MKLNSRTPTIYSMVRPTKPANERKQAVTVSLAPATLLILDNLARAQHMNRSQVIDSMLKAKGFNELGLKAMEAHTSALQGWRPKGKEDEQGACNPYHIEGKCKNNVCQALYKKWRL